MEDNIQPAKLVDGEPVITEEMAKKYKKSTTAKKNTTSKKSKSTKAETTEGESSIAEEQEDTLITAASKRKTPKTEKQVIGQTANGAIGVEAKKIEPKKVASSTRKPKAKQEEEKVAIYSERNMNWSSVGRISRGYNIVTKEQAEKWLTRPHCRLATPEEVAAEYRK